MPKKLYDKGKILDSCLTVFATHGYERTTTAMLAEASGISRTLIFHHFKSKKDLYLSLVERCFEKGRKTISTNILNEKQNFFEAKDVISTSKFNYYKKNPDVYRIITEAFYNTPAEMENEIEDKYGELIELRDKIQEKLFDNVQLRADIDRKEAYKLVKLILEHFENKFVSELGNDSKLNDQILERILNERRRFLDMIRFGIQEQGGDTE